MLDKIEADLKTALLAGEKNRVELLRGLKSALANEAIAKRSSLTEEEVISVLRKEAKKRDEAAIIYRQGGAQDRADQEMTEKTVIDAYLPAQMDEAALARLVDDAVAAIGADKAMTGQIIGHVMQAAKGQADGKIVSQLVSKKLS